MAFRHPRLTENKKTSQVRYNLTRFADSMFRGIQYVANVRIISSKELISVSRRCTTPLSIRKHCRHLLEFVRNVVDKQTFFTHLCRQFRLSWEKKRLRTTSNAGRNSRSVRRRRAQGLHGRPGGRWRSGPWLAAQGSCCGDRHNHIQ